MKYTKEGSMHLSTEERNLIERYRAEQEDTRQLNSAERRKSALKKEWGDILIEQQILFLKKVASDPILQPSQELALCAYVLGGKVYELERYEKCASEQHASSAMELITRHKQKKDIDDNERRTEEAREEERKRIEEMRKNGVDILR